MEAMPTGISFSCILFDSSFCLSPSLLFSDTFESPEFSVCISAKIIMINCFEKIKKNFSLCGMNHWFLSRKKDLVLWEALKYHDSGKPLERRENTQRLMPKIELVWFLPTSKVNILLRLR
jgi:hypothetical protein